MKRIGVFTSGGDAPGMNAAVRSVVRTAIYNKVEVIGIQRGYAGLINKEFVPMNSNSVANILHRGGTVLKTSRSMAYKTEEGRKVAYQNLVEQGIEGLICIGGDGSYTGAMKLYEEHGIPCVGVPGTIDNDIYGTDVTIGFDTAINTAMEAIDRIRDTAESHNRTFFVEVMGRHTGFIALQVGLAGGAGSIFVPETLNPETWIDDVFSPERRKRTFTIIVVAEGDEEGGAINMMNKAKNKYPELEPRVAILGHIQRGGNPTAADRILATRLGNGAVEALLSGAFNQAAGLIKNDIVFTPFAEAISHKKSLNNDLYRLIQILNV